MPFGCNVTDCPYCLKHKAQAEREELAYRKAKEHRDRKRPRQ